MMIMSGSMITLRGEPPGGWQIPLIEYGYVPLAVDFMLRPFAGLPDWPRYGGLEAYGQPRPGFLSIEIS
jgi:hypothetical protein